YRQDMENTADISEEVVRLYGFDNIEPTLFAGRMTAGGLTARQKFDVLLRQTLASIGCCEAYTYSFVSPASYAKAGLSFDPDSELVILNPLGEDTSTMRRSAVVSLLEVLARNYSRRVDEARVFELATVYKKCADGMSDETKQLVVASYGGWDFYDMKGVCEQLCEALNVTVTLGRETKTPYLHPGRSASFESNGENIAVFGQIHPQCADKCGVPHDACIAVFDAEKLYAAAAGERRYKPLPVYPSITRDLALVCDENAAAGDIIAKMIASGGKLVESAQAFDVYTGKGVDDGKKSIAFRLVLRSAEKTLSDADADAVVKRILKRLSFEDSITLRQ
ncbi:MAG TPA: phenylalanine--tRNA ligase subunit beta, partial [Bacillota bacterium]|nr:phenylalanine--tRNA ligase subunit beta [Bacillota bacterium]